MKVSVFGCLCLASLSLAATAVPAQDRKCRDVSFPEHLQVNGNDLALNGLGVRKATFLKINVYVAALYVGKTSRDAAALVNSDSPQELVLHFVRDVDVGELRKAFLEAFKRNPANASAAMQARMAKLNSWMTDVKTGQRVIFLRLPHVGVQVLVDGATRGTVEGDDFSRAFVSIWLGAEPPNPELKSGLLGGDCS